MNDRHKQNISYIRCRVLGCLYPGYLTIIVGYGYGMLDGGVSEEIPVHLIPPKLRMPNSTFKIIAQHPGGEWLYIEPLNLDLDLE